MLFDLADEVYAQVYGEDVPHHLQTTKCVGVLLPVSG